MIIVKAQTNEEKQNSHARYLIKFLSSETLYPIVLKDKGYGQLKKKYDHTNWYQHHQKNYIDIREFEKGFFGNESIYSNGTLVGNDLLLLKYENNKNILDHYEPIHFSKQLSEIQEDISYRDDEYEVKVEGLEEQIKNNKLKKIYTLAYFDDLEILIEDFDSYLSIECILDITMPIFLSKNQKVHLENELNSLISFAIKFENDTNAESVKRSENKSKDFRENSNLLQVYRAKAGPFIVKKEDLRNKKVLCELLLKDYDLTNVLRKTVNSRYSAHQKNSSKKIWNLTFWNQLILLVFSTAINIY